MLGDVLIEQKVITYNYKKKDENIWKLNYQGWDWVSAVKVNDKFQRQKEI